MRPDRTLRAAVCARATRIARTRRHAALAVAAGALLLAGTAGVVVPAAATAGSSPTASIARVNVGWRHLDVRSGRRAAVHGRSLPRRRGVRAMLQVRRGAHWRTLARDRTGTHGRYRLHRRLHRPMSAHARVVLGGAHRGLHRRIGRLEVYRSAVASWYGPGLYGNHLGCGGRLHYGTIGVAHKWLPCGARLTLRHRGHEVRARVIDRGPYVAGREFDLTAATARHLHFRGPGRILVTR